MNSMMVCLTHAYVCTMTHMCAPWLICVHHDLHVCTMTHMCAPWLICVHHDLYVCTMIDMCAPWLMCVHHDSYVCTMTHLYLFHDSFVFVPWLIHKYEWLIPIKRKVTAPLLPFPSPSPLTVPPSNTQNLLDPDNQFFKFAKARLSIFFFLKRVKHTISVLENLCDSLD